MTSKNLNFHSNDTSEGPRYLSHYTKCSPPTSIIPQLMHFFTHHLETALPHFSKSNDLKYPAGHEGVSESEGGGGGKSSQEDVTLGAGAHCVPISSRSLYASGQSERAPPRLFIAALMKIRRRRLGSRAG